MLRDVNAALIRDTPDLDCPLRLKLIFDEKQTDLTEDNEPVEESELEG